MKRMQAGEFKAHCLRVMKDVHATGEPVIVTKRGVPLVKLVPAGKGGSRLLGSMAGKVKILGDIEGPAVPAEQWGSRSLDLA
ncbi:MAG: type II toxin-antitoxin system Phd/YefM family antitoxin [Terriglobales bacterium]